MLIPKCCKGCSSRKNTAPTKFYTNELTPINFDNLREKEIKDNETYPENKKKWYDFKPTYEQSIGNWAECPNCKEKDKEIKICKERIEELAEQRENLHKEKDHRIAVLERALRSMSINYFGDAECIRFLDTGFQVNSNRELYEYFIKQAEKELEEKK